MANMDLQKQIFKKEINEIENKEEHKMIGIHKSTKEDDCVDNLTTNSSKKVKTTQVNDEDQQQSLSGKSHQGKQGLHGDTYHIKLLMLFFIRGINNGYNFRLGKEMKNAKKFDDVFFEVTREDNIKEFRLLQAKHKKNDSEKIRFNSLLTDSDSDYSLVKYFFSYQDSKKEKFLKHGKIRDVVVCTNIGLDLNDQCPLSNENAVKLCDVVEKIVETDDILYVDKQTAARYRFNENITSLLKPLLEEYNLTRLARKLSECLFRSKEIQRHDKNNMFYFYHVVLAEEVLDVPNRKFRSNFVQGESLSENANKFRQALETEIQKQSKNEISLLNINEVITDAIDKRVNLNLPKKFGEGKNKGWPRNAISDKDIISFTNDLVFAVNQPGEDELGEIIKQDLLNQFDKEKTKNIYNELCVKMLDWLNGKDKEFFTHDDAKTFFANILGAIWFGVGPLVESFTGRTEELNKLHSLVQRQYKLTVISQTTSITGLGGIGKSELARKYAYEYKKFFHDNVIWINAASNSTLEDSFRTLAENKLGIKTQSSNGKGKSISAIVQQVYEFFTSRKCLFIFDNAEFYKSMNDGDAGIDKFMPLHLEPNDNKPYCLITSRNKKWGNNTAEIELGVFTEEEAISLIKEVLNINHTSQDNDLKELAARLQHFPLALRQAVAYIKEKDAVLRNIGKRFQIKEYLKRLEEKTKDLLDFEFPEGSTDSYTKTTFIVWEVTLETILNKRYGKEALDVFNIMAYFAPNDIPVSMFSDLVTDEELLASAVELLKQYSMITSGEDPTKLNIHRLVQQVATIKHGQRVEIILNNALELITQCFNTFIKFDLPIADLKSSKVQNKNNMSDGGNLLRVLYIPHAVSAWKHASRFSSLINQFSEMPYLIIEKLRNRVACDLALTCGQQLLEGLETHLDTNHIDILKVKNNIYRLLIVKCKYGDALNGLQEILTIAENKYSTQHYLILNIKFNIGLVFQLQQNYDMALQMAKSAVIGTETYLGDDLNMIWKTKQLVAVILTYQKKFEEALTVVDNVLQTSDNGLEYNANLLSIYHLKGLIFYRQGHYDKSLQVFEEVLNVAVGILFPYDRLIITARNIVGVILRRLGKFEASLKVLKGNLDSVDGELSVDSLEYLLIEYNVGCTLTRLLRYKEAFYYFEQILLNINGNYELGQYLQVCISLTETNISEMINDYKYSLHVAVENNFVFLVKFILKETTHFWDNIKDTCGRTALDYVSDNSIRNIIESTEALFTALENGEVERVQTCLTNGAEVNALGPKGTRALHCAALISHVGLVRLLINNKADPNLLCRTGLTAFHYGVQAGNLEIIQILLEASVKPNVPDNEGELPIDLARKRFVENPRIYQEIINVLEVPGETR